MELGGSDPFIVLPSADLDAAVKTAVTARNINNGQSCIAAKRFIVHARCTTSSSGASSPALERLKVGDPMREDTDVGPLATAQILETWSARSSTRCRPGRGCSPAASASIVRAISTRSRRWPKYRGRHRAYREEVFGPVALRLQGARSRRGDRACERQRLRPRLERLDPRWKKNAARCIDELEAGSTFVNAMVASDPRLPFGGVKRSGYGRELARDGMREFVNVKAVSITERPGGVPAAIRSSAMNAAELLVRCLENEGVDYVFGIPGEENIHIMDALARSRIRFVATRHEQGAAFMADVYGRLTGRAGVCLATLGPGATNLITGVADANMDRAPLVAIAGQAATTRMHKESHQVLDLAALFSHFTKFSAQVLEPEIVPEVVRKAFKLAQAEKPGACFIEMPENVARMRATDLAPLKVQAAAIPLAPQAKVEQIARLIDEASAPLVLVGNGVIRQRASGAVVSFIERLNLPAATTFMAKGAVPASHPLCLGTIGLQARDPAAFGLERRRPGALHRLRHGRVRPGALESAARQAHRAHRLRAGRSRRPLRAGRGHCRRHRRCTGAHRGSGFGQARRERRVYLSRDGADDGAYPLKPQRLVADLRRAMAADDVLVSDVGAHKLWIARLFQAERPNTCVISNGFAAMGIALPGAIAAKLALPERRVVAVSGDGGFLMNSQELETAAAPRCRDHRGGAA